MEAASRLLRLHYFFSFLFLFVLGSLVGAALYLWSRYVPPRVVMLSQGERIAERFEFGEWSELSNPDFFGSVRKGFLDDRGDFIEADLSRMRLVLYDKGMPIKEFEILSKGRSGSWWETPAGLYRVESKEKSHFSSFGRVYQPWSVAFQGNFFIHGWPHYKDGTRVASGYSGGCIRLENADAEEIFEFARPGMPVLVYEEGFASDGFRGRIGPRDVSAENYLAADLTSNYVYVSKHSDEPRPIASIVKLVTAAVATEYMNIERMITFTEAMQATTTTPRLRVRNAYSVYDLLFLLLMESSNEAANTLSRPLGSIRFVELMARKAEAIGMTHATFIDPSGVHEGNMASAEDLFHLAKYLYHNRIFLLRMSAGQIRDSIYGRPSFSNLENFNAFSGRSDFIGGKIGKSSSALQSMLALFSVEVGGEDRSVAVAVLRSENASGDIEKIIEWIHAQYE